MDGEQGTHFYFMVIQTPVEGGFQMSESCGTITPRKGATRRELYDFIRADVVRRSPVAAHGNVVAFDVQPNEL